MQQLKVFISYATEDAKTATSVFLEMEGAGADVFQFGRSEIFGKPSWEQVVAGINQSDVFVVLISKHSLKSKPVREEIEQAHYSYINRDKPEKLVPAIIERGAMPPILIERFTQIDFTILDTGLDRLMKQLELKRRAKPVFPLKFTGLMDVGPIYAEYKRINPGPLPANEFSAQAEKLLTNYSKVAPEEIAKSDRKEHLDGILVGLSGKNYDFKGLGKYNSLFFGIDPSLKLDAPIDTTAPKLASTLASFNIADLKTPLDAPKASVRDGVIVWDEVSGAMSYEVEESLEGFRASSIAYQGTATEYRPTVVRKTHFRVRAVGGVFRAESPWSSPLTMEPEPGSSLFGIPLAKNPFADVVTPSALKLELDQATPWAITVKWSPMGLTGRFVEKSYVLESCENRFFIDSTVEYEGAATQWTNYKLSLKKRFYRVKAISAGKHTDWSNIVEG